MGQPEDLREEVAVALAVPQGTLPAQGQTWAPCPPSALSWDTHPKTGVPVGEDGVCCHRKARACRSRRHSSLWG